MGKYKIFTNQKLISVIIILLVLLTNTTSYAIIDELKNTERYEARILDDENGESQVNNELEYTSEYLEYLNSSDEEKNNYTIVPPMYKVEINPKESDEDEITSLASGKEENTASSTYYKMQNLRVENQGTSGWCWAYASLKSLETYLMKHDNIGINENYNFAEYHLAYMKYKSFNNSGWKNGNELTNDDIYAKGGNFDDFMKYTGILSKDISKEDIQLNYEILGPITGTDEDNHIYDSPQCEQFENKTPEYKVTKIIQFGCVKKKYDKDGKRIGYIDSNGKTISESDIKSFREAVKEQIVSNSAVFAYTNMVQNKFNTENGSLYLNNNDIKINHAVTIVGWDDNYSKSNFWDEPSSDGAWIAMNSWGEENTSTDEGYIYISYDDAIVEQYLYGILEVENYNTAPNIKVEYSTDKITNKSVVVTITSNGKLIAPDSSWNVDYTEREIKDYYTIYETSTKLTKIYDDNTKEAVKFQDVSGYPLRANIEIDTIDKEAPITEVVYSDLNEENNTIEVTIKANEKIQKIDGWTLSEDETILKKTFSDDSDIKLKIKDLAGNEQDVYVKVTIFQNIIGDINLDGKVNIVDLLLIKRHLIAGDNVDWKLTGQKLKSADLNFDEKVNIVDLIIIKRTINSTK